MARFFVRKQIELFPVLQCVLLGAWLLALAAEGCSSSKSQNAGDHRVIRKTDSDSDKLVVELGEDAKLFCRTNAPWKKCLWRPPRSGVKQLRCVFNKDQKKKIACPSFPEVQFDEIESQKGGSHYCAIIIRKVNEYHEGNWKCEFELEYSTKENPVIIWDKVRLDARGIRYP